MSKILEPKPHPWSFFETAHSKGPVEGVGAEVKRAVWRSILQNKEVVSSPLEFHRVAKKVCNKVAPLYVPQAEVNNQTEKLRGRWNGCRAIPRTHAIHFASKVDDVTISVAKNSQFPYNENTRQHVLIKETPPTPSSPTALISDEDDDENAPSTQSSLHALSSHGDDENAPSSPVALTSDKDDDENEDEQGHKYVDSDECDRNESTEVEDSSDESNIG